MVLKRIALDERSGCSIRLILLAIGKGSEHVAILGDCGQRRLMVGFKGTAHTASKHGTIGLTKAATL
jgi:hypothetical protein